MMPKTLYRRHTINTASNTMAAGPTDLESILGNSTAITARHLAKKTIFASLVTNFGARSKKAERWETLDTSQPPSVFTKEEEEE